MVVRMLRIVFTTTITRELPKIPTVTISQNAIVAINRLISASWLKRSGSSVAIVMLVAELLFLKVPIFRT